MLTIGNKIKKKKHDTVKDAVIDKRQHAENGFYCACIRGDQWSMIKYILEINETFTNKKYTP